MNNNSQTFVIAFDMPNEEAVAVRHKDITEIQIDGVSYPVQVTTELGTDGVDHAVYTFSDPHFSRTGSSSYISINQKNFVHTRNSVYFETNEPFAAIDKEYTPTLYKLANEGFVFKNFYQPNWHLSTTGGEYSVMTGQIPQWIGGSNSFYASSKVEMPLGLGHIFGDMGYSTPAWQNGAYTY